MRKSLILAVVALTGLACFAEEASARPWRNYYDYYYGPGTQPYVFVPSASSYYSPYSSGYTLVPPGSSYYSPYYGGYTLVPPASYYGSYFTPYTLVPPGSYYYSPVYIQSSWYDFPWSVPGTMGYMPY